MKKAPKDKRILIKTDSGEIYAATFATNTETGETAFKIANLPDGGCLLVTEPVGWMNLQPGCA